MEKKPPIKKSLARIKQPNEFTMAKYDMTRAEKNIMYFTVKHLQETVGAKPNIMEVLKDKSVDDFIKMDRTLFGDFVFTIPMSQIREINEETGNDTHTTKIWKAAESLRMKSFEVKTNRHWFSVGFFNYVHYNKDTGLLHLEMSHKLIPFILKAINNYTLYNFITAISFKKVYTQRFYEFAHRWRETGYWRTTPEELRDMLSIGPGKYDNWKDFKKKVLLPSETELRENGDIWFNYKETKHGRKTLFIEFIFFLRDKAINPEERDRIKNSADYIYTMRQLSYYLNDKKLVERIAQGLLSDENLLEKLAARVQRLDDDIASGVISSKPGGLIRKILNEDFGIL